MIGKTGRKIYLIEDACQAHGAEYQKKKLGTLGIFGGFSFYPSKNLGAYGDGGAVVSNDRSLIKKVRLLHEYGQVKKYRHDTIGGNSRLDSLQAAVLQVKLKYLDRWNRKRRAHAAHYTRLLQGTGGIRLPADDPARRSVYHVYAIRTIRRARLQTYLSEQGITTRIHYPFPLHLQKAFSYLRYKKGDFPNAEKTANEILSLPMYPELTARQIEYVAKHIKAVLPRTLR
jgi:dTDP-4-amino-4,6-dideoxygalactose transaminase